MGLTLVPGIRESVHKMVCKLLSPAVADNRSCSIHSFSL